MPGPEQGPKSLRYAAQACAALAGDPYEGFERATERLVHSAESRRHSWRYVPTDHGDRRLHAMLGVPWPCPSRREFEEQWPLLIGRVADRGRRVGRGAYGGWDDADRGLAGVVWCLTRHLRPSTVVETGVARGLTTSLILEGLQRNGEGRLWSIDLPPLIQSSLAAETGLAVRDDQRQRWTLLRGSSRRLLRGLVAGLGRVDLFVHDSMHTTRNVGFELSTVWPALAPGSIAVVDDVERNRAFASFIGKHPEADALLLAADDRRSLFGCLRKPVGEPATSTGEARNPGRLYADGDEVAFPPSA
jgi:predicted O-methyltransferase YrrM